MNSTLILKPLADARSFDFRGAAKPRLRRSDRHGR
jgi:hypothetical protein